MDDIRAVLDDLGVEQTAILAQGYATPIAVLFAATYPERTSSLVLYAPSAKGGLGTDDHPWGATEEEHAVWVERASRLWGTREFAAEWLERLAPSVAGRRANRRVDGEGPARRRQPGRVPRSRR